jgi:hypothetical protein
MIMVKLFDIGGYLIVVVFFFFIFTPQYDDIIIRLILSFVIGGMITFVLYIDYRYLYGEKKSK